jgi:hypothetical protein
MPIEKLQNHLIFRILKFDFFDQISPLDKRYRLAGMECGVTANWVHLASSSLAYVAMRRLSRTLYLGIVQNNPLA